MNVVPVGTMPAFKSNVNRKNRVEVIPVIHIPVKSDDYNVTAYGNWGGGYIYPVTVSKLKPQQTLPTYPNNYETSDKKDAESEEDYYNRKLYSTEWCS